MRLLADENIPLKAITRLRELGHEVLSAKESMRGKEDLYIPARAVAEERILLAFDKDFGELAFRSQLPATCGIILLRFTQRGRDHDADMIVQTLHLRSDWTGAFWTLTDQRLRRRTLPGVSREDS